MGVLGWIFSFCGGLLVVVIADDYKAFAAPGWILVAGGVVILQVGPIDLQFNVLGGVFAALGGWVFYINDVKHLFLPRWLMAIAGILVGVGLLLAIAQPFPPIR